MFGWKNGNTQFGESPIATNGCGHFVCFEETNYEENAGELAVLIIEYFGSGVPPEEEVIVAGTKFRISHTNNGLASEWHIDPNLQASVWIGAIGNTIAQHQSFRDFDITWSSNNPKTITITAKEEGFHPEFDQTDLKFDTTGFRRGSEGGLTETNGAEKTFKGDYYAFLKIIDPETGEPICSTDFEVPMNINEDGSTTACFELSSIIRQLPKIYVTPPEVGDPLYFQDDNQQKWFSIEAYGKYRDSQSNCGKLQTRVIGVGGGLLNSGYSFVRAIEQPDDERSFKQKFASFSSLFMTDKPETYKVCKDSPMYFRFYRRIGRLPDPLTFTLVGEMTYGDGSTETIQEQIFDREVDPADSDVHVLNLQSIMYNSQYFNQQKAFVKFVFKIVYYETGFINGDLTQEHTLLFDNSPQGHCCGCHKAFTFQGEAGNNDTIVARCESLISLDVDFNKIGKIQECGEYEGGTVPLTQAQLEEKKTVWIYTEEWEYLLKFLASPIKHVKAEKGTAERFVRIYPTETSYEVYKANNAGRLKFTYVESVQKNSY